MYKAIRMKLRGTPVENLYVVYKQVSTILLNDKYRKYKNKMELIKKVIKQEIEGLPRSICIEISSVCPLDCPFCIIKELKTYKKRRKSHMNYKEYKSIINQISSFCTYIELSGGEPLTNKDIFKMLKYSNKKQIPVLMATNCILLDEKACKKLLDNPPFELLVSFESPDKDTYEMIRKNAKYDVFMENIKRLIKEKKKRKQYYPRITLQMVLTKKNEYQQKYYKHVVKELGADYARIKPIGVWAEGSEEYHKNMEKEYVIDKKDNPISRNNLVDGKILYRTRKPGECTTYRMCMIGSGGEIIPCYYVIAQDYSPGNVHDEEFLKIWEKPVYKAFRYQMFNGNAYGKLCDRCLGFEGE